jgi:quinol monooxygenase YgiN
MIVREFTFIVNNGCEKKFSEILDHLIAKTYINEKPLYFDYEIKDRIIFFIKEVWSSLNDFNKHQQSHHLKEFQRLRHDLISSKIDSEDNDIILPK